jgi:hypothetical protein
MPGRVFGTNTLGWLHRQVLRDFAAHSLVFYVDFVFVARDRAGIELDAFNVGKPFDRATEITLARKMYDRISTKAG